MKQGLTEYEAAAVTLKTALKKQRITYAQLAKGLGISESGVKKILNASDGSFQRIAQISRYLGLAMAELLSGEGDSVFELTYTEKQQQYLLEQPNALRLYWLLVYERESIERAEKRLKITARETFSILRKLDQLNLLALLPGNRLRIPAVQPVRWKGDGPLIKKLYKDWSQRFLADVAKPGQEVDRLFLIRYFKVQPRTLHELIVAQRALEVEFERRAIQDMRSESPDLVHLRWMAALDSRSFLGGE